MVAELLLGIFGVIYEDLLVMVCKAVLKFNILSGGVFLKTKYYDFFFKKIDLQFMHAYHSQLGFPSLICLYYY